MDNNGKEVTLRPNGKGWVWDDQKRKWFRVRKLIPRECFRLMGVDNADIDKIQTTTNNKKGEKVPLISESQQYKLAGNSIVVDVMYHCFVNLFIGGREDVFTGTLF